MFGMFFNRYVLYALLAAFWSFGVWHISAGYSENVFNKERLALIQKQDAIRIQNDELKSTISKSLQDGLTEARGQIQKSIQQGLNEIKTNPIYTTCRITNGVRDAYKSAIKS